MNVIESCKDEMALKRYRDMSFEVQCIVDNILNRFEDSDEYSTDNLFYAVDDELIYYEDMWNILKEYCLPNECSWEQAIDDFLNDLLFIATFCFEMTE